MYQLDSHTPSVLRHKSSTAISSFLPSTNFLPLFLGCSLVTVRSSSLFVFIYIRFLKTTHCTFIDYNSSFSFVVFSCCRRPKNVSKFTDLGVFSGRINSVFYSFPFWEMAFSTAALADAIAEEGITFAKGPLGWDSCSFFHFKYSNKDISLSEFNK